MSEWPVVSLLIAARNEEETILACLQAVDQLDYPAGQLDILIGNDQSTDNTRAVIRRFIADKPHFRLLDVTTTLAGLAGKTNVLAQLAQQARGQFLFFTDADTRVPTRWIKAMLAAFSAETGIVSGITLPQGTTLFHHLQALDWLYALTQTYLLSALSIPVTAPGNNMAVRHQGYRDVGGYERLAFSITEDYALFWALIREGYGFQNRLSPDVLAFTKPVDTLSALWQQRKRWMRGAFSLPGWLVAGLLVQSLALPLLLALSLVAPGVALGLYIVKFTLQTALLLYALRRLRQTQWLPYVLIFEGYQLFIGPTSLLYYLLSGPVRWKDRIYS